MSAWGGRVARAVARARRRGGPVLAVASSPLRDAPDPLELFDGAERAGEARFLLVHPAEDLALVALGRAAGLDGALDSERSSAQVAAWLDAETDLVRGEPLFVAGGAFASRPGEARDPAWRAFGDGMLVAPELLFCWRRGAARVTRLLRVHPDDDVAEILARRARREAELLAKGPPAAARSARSVPPPLPDARYRDAAAAAIAAIRRGELEKVVLAQAVARGLPDGFRCAPALAALIRDQASSCTFAIGRGDATFLGATPERLVRSAAGRVEAHALAGTAAAGRRGDGSAAALRRSGKERAEHALVVREIAAALRPLCRELSLPGEPELAAAGGVVHLRTRIEGRLRAPRPALELALRLHPTPALGGTPRDAALRWIERREGFDRGWYGGPFGWLDATGDGDFFVALRCGLVRAGGAVAYAGSGLVAGSDPDAEALETAQKLRTLWEALDAE